LNILLDWIHELNNFDGNAPKFVLFADEDVDEKLANRDKTLTETGLKFTKKYYMKTYGFEEDDIEISASEVGGNGVEFAEPAEKISKKDPIDEVDGLIDSFEDEELENLMSEDIEKILKIFSETNDITEVEDALNVLYPDMNTTEFEKMLAKTLFMADLWGRGSAREWSEANSFNGGEGKRANGGNDAES
jgi:phage gp29-like protein